jgi:hypothetical protein
MTKVVRKRSYFATGLLALGMISALAIQQRENEINRRQCTGGIYNLGEIKTSLGSAYVCISRVKTEGPTTPLKP